MDRLFPKEIIENSQEKNFSRHTITSRVIYISVVLFLMAMVGLLPFIKTDVGIRSSGIMRPVTERVTLHSPVPGPIQKIFATENQTINRGEIFAVLEAPELFEQIRFNQSRRRKLQSFRDDLILLQEANFSNVDVNNIDISLHTTRYQQSLHEFHQQLFNKKQKVERLERIFLTEKSLLEKNATSLISLDEARYEMKDAEGQYKLFVKQQKNHWKQEYTRFTKELKERESELVRLRQEQKRYEVRSPVTGTVLHIPGIHQNSYVYANQILGEISPDTGLVAEIHVSPQDIGLLSKGMPVRIQIDAYNHHQWGLVNGTISSIATDIQVKEEGPFFRVLCSLDQDYLELSNGVRGVIKKGMTLQARFIVSRRSLYQLLYDKTDDWLNPAWSKK